jgi:hypothetical protein
MPELKHLSRRTPHEEIWEAFDNDGGLIIDDFLDFQTLQKLRDDVLPAVANHPAGASTGHEFWKDFHGNETKRITGLADMSPTWGEVLCDSLYKGMADHYLGEDNYHLNTGQLICI